MKAIVNVQMVVEGLPDNVKPEHVFTELTPAGVKFIERRWEGNKFIENVLQDARVTTFCTDTVQETE